MYLPGYRYTRIVAIIAYTRMPYRTVPLSSSSPARDFLSRIRGITAVPAKRMRRNATRVSTDPKKPLKKAIVQIDLIAYEELLPPQYGARCAMTCSASPQQSTRRSAIKPPPHCHLNRLGFKYYSQPPLSAIHGKGYVRSVLVRHKNKIPPSVVGSSIVSPMSSSNVSRVSPTSTNFSWSWSSPSSLTPPSSPTSPLMDTAAVAIADRHHVRFTDCEYDDDRHTALSACFENVCCRSSVIRDRYTHTAYRAYALTNPEREAALQYCVSMLQSLRVLRTTEGNVASKGEVRLQGWIDAIPAVTWEMALTVLCRIVDSETPLQSDRTCIGITLRQVYDKGTRTRTGIRNAAAMCMGVLSVCLKWSHTIDRPINTLCDILLCSRWLHAEIHGTPLLPVMSRNPTWYERVVSMEIEILRCMDYRLQFPTVLGILNCTRILESLTPVQVAAVEGVVQLTFHSIYTPYGTRTLANFHDPDKKCVLAAAIGMCVHNTLPETDTGRHMQDFFHRVGLRHGGLLQSELFEQVKSHVGILYTSCVAAHSHEREYSVHPTTGESLVHVS